MKSSSAGRTTPIPSPSQCTTLPTNPRSWGVGGRVGEHDDVAAFDVAEAVRQPVDQDPIVLDQRRDPWTGRDVERLDQERLDDDGDDERRDREEPEFAQEPPGGVGMFVRVIARRSDDWFEPDGLE